MVPVRPEKVLVLLVESVVEVVVVLPVGEEVESLVVERVQGPDTV